MLIIKLGKITLLQMESPAERKQDKFECAFFHDFSARFIIRRQGNRYFVPPSRQDKSGQTML